MCHRHLVNREALRVLPLSFSFVTGRSGGISGVFHPRRERAMGVQGGCSFHLSPEDMETVPGQSSAPHTPSVTKAPFGERSSVQFNQHELSRDWDRSLRLKNK